MLISFCRKIIYVKIIKHTQFSYITRAPSFHVNDSYILGHLERNLLRITITKFKHFANSNCTAKHLNRYTGTFTTRSSDKIVLPTNDFSFERFVLRFLYNWKFAFLLKKTDEFWIIKESFLFQTYKKYEMFNCAFDRCVHNNNGKSVVL